ncbi:MAG: tRNA epoxyqueuosine(34) reductase QueG [Bacteroidales bacterium]|nr:tRNA epoxyqueuosine(34) reductase QueG [Bacteroidales bacterium]
MNISEKTELIKNQALKTGFNEIGIIKADFLSSEKEHLQKWIDNNYHADMSYMKRNFEKRLNPNLLVENAKSVIVVLKNYFPQKQQNNNTYQISKYAYGADYHKILKDDLYKLFEFINKQIEPVNGRVFVDSAPVLERSIAKKAGLGWIGKNSMLLTKKGSFFFIGELIIDIELTYSTKQINSYCGSCTKCIEACPTGAIIKPYIINSNNCISYQTIEKKGEFENDFNLNFKNNIFGCDICQDVCPWNKKSIPTEDERFNPHFLLLQLEKKDWENISEQTFNNIFINSAVKRTKYTGLYRNINYIKNKQK